MNKQKPFLVKIGGKATSTPAGVMTFLVDYLKKPRDRQLILVLSAFGKGTNALEYLYNYFCEIDSGNLSPRDFKGDPRSYFEEYASVLLKNQDMQFYDKLFDKVEIVCSKIAMEDLNDYEKNKFKAELLAQGEIMSVALLSEHLQREGVKHVVVPAHEYIHTDSNFCNAEVMWPETSSALSSAMHNFTDAAKWPIIIVHGFIGRDRVGNITNLGRDGSDLTAMLVAQAYGLREVTLCKDVKGVYYPNADRNDKPISLLSYREAREYVVNETGTLIFPLSIDFAEKNKIAIYVAHYNAPEQIGTTITRVAL